jgi:hypothetical protein
MATYAEEKYRLAQRNAANLRAVSEVSQRTMRTVAVRAGELPQQAMGAYLRETVPGVIDQFGKLNAVAAVQHYQSSRTLALANIRGQFADPRRAADRIATAQLQGAIYRASLPTFDPVEQSKPVINYAMAAYMDQGPPGMVRSVQQALTRAVAGYNRDTMLYNTALDPGAISVQRVANPGACPFCSTMAFSSTRSGGSKLQVRTAQYAIEFHRNCECTIETLYAGDSPIRPPYYDQLELEYSQSGGDLNEWRRLRQETTALVSA